MTTNSFQSSFASNYHEARESFRRESESAIGACRTGGTIENFRHPELGPDGNPLSTDTTWIGPKEAAKVLVTVSATHGVEGFCGSGAQVDWLRRQEWARLPEDTAALLVHAINPYGFAWCRRVTHENVDLNRNWIDFDGDLPASGSYDEIAELMAPDDWNDEVRKAMLTGVHKYIAANGEKKFLQAVSGGQHRYPDGLFYGGQEASWSRETLTRIAHTYLRRAQSIAFLDYHSGLGPTGYGECITTHAPGSEAFERARSWYGARVSSIDVSASALIAGDWLSAMPKMLAGAKVTTIAMEFGTLKALEVLQALVADNWLHTRARGSAGPQVRAQIETEMRAAFYSNNDLWRGMVLGQSLVACRQAITGLQGT